MNRVAGSLVVVFLGFAAPASAAPAAAPARLLEEALAEAVPARGYQSRIALADSIVRLVRAGVLDPWKLEALYARRGGLPAALKAALDQPSERPITLTRQNASLYVNLLWPVGLANRLAANRESPLNGPQASRLASTAGWRLGREADGAGYFNRFAIVELAPTQQALVARIARATFRPCCDNSTFFQDCNHGSALLGLLALGASQGLNEDELYREALAFNAFWFPSQYAHTALYFSAVRGKAWADVDAREAMGRDYSSASGWRKNVATELHRRGWIPAQDAADCGA